MSSRSSSSSSRMSQSPVATLQVAMRPLEGPLEGPSSASSAPTPSTSSSTPINTTTGNVHSHSSGRANTATMTSTTSTNQHQQTNVSNHDTRSTISSTCKTKNTGMNHHCHPHGITSTTPKTTHSKKRRLPTPTSIICPVDIDTTAAPSHKKRKGLVRRTHSPKNVPSPKSTPIKPLPTQRLQQPHPQHPKTSQSPLQQQQQQQHSPQTIHASSPPLLSPPISPRLSLRHVAPTIKGVAEGARVVLNGNIMTIPTESTYVACTACQLINTNTANEAESSHNNNTTNATNSKRCLELMILANVKAAATAAAIAITKANTYAPTNAATQTTPSSPTPYGVYYKRPLVLVRSVMDVGNIIPLPIKVYAVQRPPSPTHKPKSIPEHTIFQQESAAATITTTPLSPLISKQPQSPSTPLSTTDSIISSTSTAASNNGGLIKAAFSETRQVLQRLAFLYWPGPIEIYVSVEQKGNSATDLQKQPPKYPKELLQPFPLPLKQRETNTRCHVYYVGFKCSSHPLTGRVLTEVANQQQQQQKAPSKDSTNSLNTTFVMGVDCYSTAASSYCTKATQVCDSLLRQSSSTHNHKSAYVLNGEDKREMFAVPPCQMKDTTSLYVDTFHRSIYICGTSSPKSVSSSMLSCGGDADQIRRALLQKCGAAAGSSEVERPRSTSGASSTSIDSLASTSSSSNNNNRNSIRTQHRHRVMQAVLRKWKVIDFRR